MSNSLHGRNEIDVLLDRVFDGIHTDGDALRLNDILRSDIDACRRYIAYVELHGRLSWGDGIKSETPFAIPLPSLPTTHYPLPTAFVGGPVFSYMVATVVLCLMLLGAWAYKISHITDSQVVNNIPRSTISGPEELVFVGKITGMKDCRWSVGDTQTIVGAAVPLNRRYALASGLLEITYKSGAKIILEGPCTYKVASDAGGHLELGKLTASIIGAKPQASNPDPRTPNPDSRNSSLIPHPSSFVVTTPTAIVTDLGTEFGVEVAENGDTTSYVFQGSVKVQANNLPSPASGRGAGGEGGVQLGIGDSILVTKDKTDQVRFTHPTKTPKFVRRLYAPQKHLDLLDIVAGGNGLGHRRESGVDPHTGIREPVFYRYPREGGNGFQPVTWHTLIDGVFIPHGGNGPVQVDSAGHIFKECPNTQGKTWGAIWPRDAEVKEPELAKETIYWMYAMGRGERFMPEGRGLLCFSSNMGITFDLNNIRNTNADLRPTRFQATAGMVDAHFHVADPMSLADVWVLLDGNVKFKRLKLRPEDGTLNIDVPLDENDRFLTIVITDGGNKHAQDWIVFGDPVLQLTTDTQD